jgi:hypothetical protein
MMRNNRENMMASDAFSVSVAKTYLEYWIGPARPL